MISKKERRIPPMIFKTRFLCSNLKQSVREALAGRTKFNDTHFEELQNSSLTAKFKILNLVSEENIAHNKSGKSTQIFFFSNKRYFEPINNEITYLYIFCFY